MAGLSSDVEMQEAEDDGPSVEQLATLLERSIDVGKPSTDAEYNATDIDATETQDEHHGSGEESQQAPVDRLRQAEAARTLKARQLQQDSERIRELIKIANPNFDIFVSSTAVAKRAMRVLSGMPKDIKPHKTYGGDQMCALRALATAIAGTQAFRCAWRRKKYESELYSELEAHWAGSHWESNDFRQRQEAQVLQGIAMQHPELWKAAAKGVALAECRALSARSIHFFLEKFAEVHDWAGRYELIVLSYQANGKTLVGAEVYVQRELMQYDAVIGDVPETSGRTGYKLVLRNIQDLYWEGYAPVLDSRDISSDGQVGRLDPLDPRINEGALPPGHHCHEHSIFTCSPQTDTKSGKNRAETRKPFSSAMELTESRQASVEGFEKMRMVVNPSSIPKGLGDWAWLQLGIDDVYANKLGYVDPQHVTLARQSRELELGHDQQHMPVVIFKPDWQFWNPLEVPDTAGQFMYLTEDDEHAAALEYGGQPMYGFANVPTPSACQVWSARRERAGGAKAVVGNVSIVWVPSAQEDAVMEADAPEDEQGTGVETDSAHPAARQDKSDAAQIRDLLGLAPFTAAQTQMFSKAHVLWRESNPTFSRLKTADFSDLRELLSTWFSCLDFIQAFPGAARTCMLMPLHVLVVKALNDRASKSKMRGKLRFYHRLEFPRHHDDSEYMNTWLALFGAIAWSGDESEEWRSRPPREQLRMSDTATDWMWREPETPLLPLAILHSKKSPSAGDNAYVFELPWKFSEVGKELEFGKNNPLIVLCMPDEIIPVTLKDIWKCRELDLSWSYGDLQDSWKWTYKPDNKRCREWAAERKLLDEGDLAELLLKVLRDTHSEVRSGVKTDAGPPHFYEWFSSERGCRMMSWSMMWNLLNSGR